MAKAKILAVDDNPFICKLLKTRLEANDFEVVLAFSGKEALEKAPVEKPDVILLDVSMPEIDGIETGKQLKLNIETRDIPIIMVTARGEHATIVKAVSEVDPVGYVVKPFNPSLLLEEIQKALDKKRG